MFKNIQTLLSLIRSFYCNKFPRKIYYIIEVYYSILLLICCAYAEYDILSMFNKKSYFIYK